MMEMLRMNQKLLETASTSRQYSANELFGQSVGQQLDKMPENQQV